MLGLHNVFLTAPPPYSSSFQQQPISSSHQINSTIHDQCNISNNQDSWTTFKRYHQQESSFAKGHAFNVGEDNENTTNTSSRVCGGCGNRAKKECEYRRCRTCCKSRGYDCATHIKSTWVPAARRRERQGTEGGGAGGSSGSSSGGAGNKRPRENVTTKSNSFSTSHNNAAASFSFDNGSNYQDASFKQSLPNQVRAPGVFRCIRVTAISGGEAEVAYQAIVNISGHVFKGFLYDQGIDEKNLFPCISKIPPVRRKRDSTSPIVDPPYAYPASASYRFLEAGNE
ncbi:protein SHI RELATED SEQUENCE 6 isoform X2 [Hevea brasiliensis]|uniref:protein SHI RELATED SEQUENCE 6 isoform X2 n=1 Tax=Hevea brasiliensis TaxID=3981 RepID=UPI0025D2695F|nr:protein SHI RELATED SEQUENCE 6 isoform X2 [Hevea brasiliensis]